MTRNLESNIWKSFLYMLTLRRHYITILAIYFLTLPDTTAKMIGLYVAIGSFVAFIIEIPSGYFADLFGHKKTLILSKIILILSTLSFIFLQNFYGFIVGSIFLSVSFALSSGTLSAFIHETLTELKREKEFSKIIGKLRANVSLISVFLIIGLPFLVQINILLPLIVNLFFDIFGLIIALTLVNPKTHEKIIKNKSIFRIIKESKKLNFLPYAIFFGSISGFVHGDVGYRFVYLESLGYPIIFLGIVMGLSRFVWFLVGHYSYLIEKYFTVKQHLRFEFIFFISYFFLVGFLSNPYIVGLIFIIVLGYYWGRTQIIENHILNNYVSDKRYKATVLSIASQIGLIFKFVLPFILSFIMTYSYKLGYYFLGSFLLVILTISYIFIKK